VRVALHPEARAELRAAAIWYDERKAGLGDELLAEVSALLTRIGAMPDAFPTWPGTSAARSGIAKAIVLRFPYLIAFEKRSRDVLVLAIPHAKRRPLYWLTRAL